MGRRGWDGGKHRSPGIYQIPQASKSCFAVMILLDGEMSLSTVQYEIIFVLPL